MSVVGFVNAQNASDARPVNTSFPGAKEQTTQVAPVGRRLAWRRRAAPPGRRGQAAFPRQGTNLFGNSAFLSDSSFYELHLSVPLI